MARPRGITKSVQMDRRIIAQMDELKKRVADDVIDAYQVTADLMRDDSASPTVRKTAADTIIKLHNTFYKEASGDPNAYEEESAAHTVERVGNVLSLKFQGGN